MLEHSIDEVVVRVEEELLLLKVSCCGEGCERLEMYLPPQVRRSNATLQYWRSAARRPAMRLPTGVGAAISLVVVVVESAV
jgi:hypothetical protein